VVVGLTLFIGTLLAWRRAYAQCRADHLLLSSLFRRLRIPYETMNNVQSVQMGKVFNVDSLKRELDRELLTQFLPESALEIELNKLPKPLTWLRRRWPRLMISPRSEGFIIVVPKPAQLAIEISAFQQRLRDAASLTRYLDPIERAQYQRK
jgi:hypothetical protein